jgi:hypothetical protein
LVEGSLEKSAVNPAGHLHIVVQISLVCEERSD